MKQDGMMDIARHGIFQPEHFAFNELMYIFLAVMVTDIILLDIAFHYDNITEGLLTENVKKLRKSFYELKDNKEILKNLRRKETICMRRIDQEIAMTM